MSTQELGTKETVLLEQFEYKYGGDRAMDLTAKFCDDPIEGPWIDADNVVSIMHESVDEVGPLGMNDIQSDIESWGVIKSDKGKELLELESSGTTTYVATEYADMVCDLFDVELNTFIENTQMNGSYGEWPILYDDEDTTFVALIAPFINK